MLEALQAVAARLREHDVPFLLGGSALLRALGLDVEVRDVDGVEVEGLGGVRITGGAELPFRGEGEWHGIPLAAPEVWYAAYRAYNPEKAALLEPLIRRGGQPR